MSQKVLDLIWEGFVPSGATSRSSKTKVEQRLVMLHLAWLATDAGDVPITTADTDTAIYTKIEEWRVKQVLKTLVMDGWLCQSADNKYSINVLKLGKVAKL